MKARYKSYIRALYTLISTPGIDPSHIKKSILLTLRQYSEFDADGKQAWHNLDVSRNMHIRCSVDAKKLIDMTNDYRVVHFEHITPVAVLYDELMKCKSLRDVFLVIQKSEIVYLTLAEAAILDGPKSRTISLKGKEVSCVSMKRRGTREERMGALATLGVKFTHL